MDSESELKQAYALIGRSYVASLQLRRKNGKLTYDPNMELPIRLVLEKKIIDGVFNRLASHENRLASLEKRLDPKKKV